ncbi:MAG: DUF4249 domain-containing protein [Bacteroidetes bacterium]|nr:DUF4249 domain-containing protein [Bacteroidota bacterium]
MRRIKNISVIFVLLLLFSCIKIYNPNIDAKAEKKYVVSGRITGTEGWQEVEVSLSSPIESPEYIPVPDCQVRILDDKGNVFSLEEYKPGHYHVWIGQEYLLPGTSYKVRVTTSGGEELASGFDKMPTGPVLDSVYYLIKDIPTPDPEINLRVMQFYIDLKAQGNYSQYYKWEVVETWEYHAAHRIQYYYDGTVHRVSPPDYSKVVCWDTNPVKNVFTLSTKSLSQNTYNQYPLHVIDGHTSRLAYLYSILVFQYALSEGAYNYWEQLRINSNEQGGLYEKQPLAIKGNLLNVSHPEREVLGYFYAASVSSRRYFYHDIEGIELDFNNGCIEEELGMGGWKNVNPWDYPVYFYYKLEVLKILSNECVDCRLLGGTIVKPDFWPK